MARNIPHTKKWLTFEHLVAKLHKDLDPDATVRHNVKLPGKSGRKRQIDVLVEKTSGPYCLRIVIECKDKKRPVDIGIVDAFVGKLQDVDGHQGVIVSSSGFDSGAIERANSQNIVLMDLREATQEEWFQYLPRIPIFRAVEYYEKLMRSRFRLVSSLQSVSCVTRDKRPVFVDKAGAQLTDVDLRTREWQDGRIKFHVGTVSHRVYESETLKLLTEHEPLDVAEVWLELEIGARGYEKVIGFAEGYAFIDPLTKEPTSVNAVTPPTDVQDIVRDWPHIELNSDDEVAAFKNRPAPPGCLLIKTVIA